MDPTDGSNSAAGDNDTVSDNSGPSANQGDQETGDKRGSAEAPAPRQSFKRRHWGKLLLLTLVALPVLVVTVWSYSALGWSYSEGYRAGVLQKFSKKGYVCKTWEGTLYISQGLRADSFMFSVRGDSVAHILDSLNGKQVSLHYQQHVGVPSSCFGESEYFVTGVRELKTGN